MHAIVNPEFAEDTPEDLLAFLEKFYWSPLDMERTAAGTEAPVTCRPTKGR